MICSSTQGKSNIFGAVVKESEKAILVIADGAAFGSEMEKTFSKEIQNSL